MEFTAVTDYNYEMLIFLAFTSSRQNVCTLGPDIKYHCFRRRSLDRYHIDLNVQMFCHSIVYEFQMEINVALAIPLKMTH